MVNETYHRGLLMALGLACLLLAFACGQSDERDVAKTKTDTVMTTADEIKTDVEQVAQKIIKPADTITLTAQLTAQLAAADGLDGETDKIIHRCAGCALAMDGKADHGLEVADYTMHFCSEFCQKNFAKETETKILALSIP